MQVFRQNTSETIGGPARFHIFLRKIVDVRRFNAHLRA